MMRILRPGRNLARDTRAVSAVEFALISPLLLLIVAFTLDFGAALYLRFQLDQAVTASAGYGLVHASMVSPADAPDLAARMAGIAGGDPAVSVSIIVNNGPRADQIAGILTASGDPQAVTHCYCPRTVDNTPDFGDRVTCGTLCPGGEPSGRYITVSAMRPHRPLFFDYGITRNGFVSAHAMVRAQ